MKKFIKEYAWCFWCSAVLTVAGWSFLTWQFYVAVIPIVVLVEWKSTND